MTDDQAASLGGNQLPDLNSNARLQKPFANLQVFVQDSAARVLFCAESAGRLEALKETLAQLGLDAGQVGHWHDFANATQTSAVTVAPLDRGLWLPDANLALVTEAQLFGNRIAQRRRRRQNQTNTDLIIKNLTELHIGDAVVHIDHGVGRYLGLQTITTDDQSSGVPDSGICALAPSFMCRWRYCT